jgi:hypothetical protein
MEQGFVGRIDPATRKCDLSAMALDVVGAPDVNHVQVAIEFKDRHQHGSAASLSGSMAREPINRIEVLAQARDTLLDSFACAHVPALTRISSEPP